MSSNGKLARISRNETILKSLYDWHIYRISVCDLFTNKGFEMQIVIDFFLTMKPQAQTVIALALVIAIGMAIGKFHVWGIGLGIGGVLFAGLAGGHILHSLEVSQAAAAAAKAASGVVAGSAAIVSAGAEHGPKSILNKEVLEFLREFGLILFVYTIGMQVGPGFFASLKKNGLPLNIMAASIVFLGVLIAAAVHLYDPAKIPVQVAVGLLSGATTNTPGLGAAQQILSDVVGGNSKEMSAMAYAVAYPFGIVGIILTMILIRLFFKLDPQKSAENFAKAQSAALLKPVNANIIVEKTDVLALNAFEIAQKVGANVTISRYLRNGTIDIVTPTFKLQKSDVIHAVGPQEELNALEALLGSKADIDLKKMDSVLTTHRVLVTEKAVLGKTIAELDLHSRHGVTVTRVIRSGVEFAHNTEMQLQYGDKVLVVGPKENLAQVGKMMGDSIHKYNHPLLIPMFIGIFLGILLGAIPIPLGLPVPLKLGLAGGPLVMAIILARVGRVGSLVFHIPSGPNLWVREIGIVLFLACVGLMSGGKFIDTLVNGDGAYWMMMGTLITAVPLFIVGFGARFFFKTNYMQLCGVLAGSMTDPPALAFANGIANSDAPAVAYATVYPLVMLLRILTAQLFVILLSQI